MNIFNNQLRIINGKLLIYSQAYYNALHQETVLLAELQNKIDLMGAECRASIIVPSASTANSKLDLTAFKETYSSVVDYQNEQHTLLLNHTTVLEDYFTKYLNAQQRFLKNIKNFRDYFEAKVNFAASNLYQYTLQFTTPDFRTLLLNASQGEQEWQSNQTYYADIDYYSFQQLHMTRLDSNFKQYIGYAEYSDGSKHDNVDLNNYGTPQIALYRYDQTAGYSLIDVISKRNYTNYYLLPEVNKIQCTSNDLYINNRHYYDVIIKIAIRRNTADSD